MTCDTVRIVVPVTDGNPDGIVVINKSDYELNPEAYTLADGVSDDQKPGDKSGDDAGHEAGKHKKKKPTQ